MRNYIFPYPVLTHDLRMTLTHILLDQTVGGKLDQNEISDMAVDSETLQIFLWADERKDWESVSISLQVELPREEISRLREFENNIDAVAVANCGKSNLRQTWKLKRMTGDGYRWTGIVKLDKRQYIGAVDVQCILTGTILGRESRFFAESPIWTLHFDEAQSPPVRGAIPIEWANFQEDEERIFLRKYANETHYLAIEDTTPTLYLNSGFEGLPGLLAETPRPTGSRLALFESVNISIAKSVWLALFQTALVGINKLDDESDYDWPDVRWQKDVLKQLLPHIYPNQDDEAALQEAGEALNSGVISRLQSDALAVINQSIINEGKAIRKAIYQIERESQEK